MILLRLVPERGIQAQEQEQEQGQEQEREQGQEQGQELEQEQEQMILVLLNVRLPWWCETGRVVEGGGRRCFSTASWSLTDG